MSKTKAVRVNHSTKVQDIIATMLEEMPKARYFFRKQYGGKQRCLKAEDEMLNRALEEKQDQMTDINDWISQVGNRWETYTHAKYYPKAQYAKIFHYSFIYYETLASCGAFFPLYSEKQTKGGNVKENGVADGVLAFTAHFFYQMSQRTGKAYRSKELIKEFIATKCEHALTAYEDGEIIVKFKGGHGFGKELSRSPRLIEVRTYLTDEQLNNSQRRKCEAVDALYEMTRDGMFMTDVAAHAAYHRDWSATDIAKEGMKQQEIAKKLGMEVPMYFSLAVHGCFIRVLESLLHIEVSIQQSAVIAALTSENIMPFVQKWAFFNGGMLTPEQEAEFKKGLIDVMVKNAKMMKLKYVNRDTISQLIDDIIGDSLHCMGNGAKN